MKKKSKVIEEYKKNLFLKEKKREKERLRFLVITGIIIIAVSMGIFFGYCRPFKKFVYYECIVKNKEWFLIDDNYVKVIYYVDGQEYENKFKLTMRKGEMVYASFYYNANDPNEIIHANRGCW